MKNQFAVVFSALAVLSGGVAHAQLLAEHMLASAISRGQLEKVQHLTGSFGSPEAVRVMNSLLDRADFAPSLTPEPAFYCFDPVNPPKPEVIEAVNRAMLQFAFADYNIGGRWSGTVGTPRALTWSFVPDGTLVPGLSGQSDAASNLFSQMDSKFAGQGGRATWIAQFQACFDRWAALTGTSYTRISVGGNDWDDGAAFPETGGSAGARGDVRISGRTLDGASGVLAFNYFPSTGDMVMDTAENWGNSTNTYRFLRNTVMHEHGHGLGFSHVCSSDSGQLMEPFLSTSFDGPQHDEIRAGARNYGDAYESNNTAATATVLGTLISGGSFNPSAVPAPAVSNGSRTAISTDGDADWFRFDITSGVTVTINVAPVGFTYDSSTQNGDGSCNSGSPINSLQQADLVITLYASNGTTVLQTANATALGGSEAITSIGLSTVGAYYVRITDNNAPTQAQLYNLTISATGGCTAPAISAQPQNQLPCPATAASFSVTATGTSPTYQWRRNTVNISGATAATYTIANPGAGDVATYDCVITNACGSVTSTGATLTLGSVPSITGQPSNQTVCPGQPASFTVVASGTPGVTYQWRRNGANFAGATSSTYSIPSASGAFAGTWDCVVTNACGSVISTAATLTVNNAPIITAQPGNQTVCAGSPASFTVGAVGVPTPTVQWRRNLTPIPGATNLTLTLASPAAADAGSYDCVVTNACGTSTSNAATLVVNSAPSITTQPTLQTVCAGSPASFTVAATGTGSISYQWRRNTANIPGATAATYSIPSAASGDAGSYDCVVTNNCGSTTSAAVPLVVNAGPSITTGPANATVAAGDPASFSVVATGTAPLTYQWRFNTTNIPGATAASYAIASTTTANAGSYDCIVTNPCGNATSTAASLTVSSCIADTDDGSGTGTPDGGVGIEDLLYYLALYDAGSPGADVDDGSSTGTPDGGVGIEDLLYYLSRYDAGC